MKHSSPRYVISFLILRTILHVIIFVLVRESDINPIKKRTTSKYVAMKERAETISSAMKLAQSDNSDQDLGHSYTESYFEDFSSSAVYKEVDVQCEMGLEISPIDKRSICYMPPNSVILIF